MFWDFVYTPQMQIFLAVVTFVLTFFTTYLVAEIMLNLCDTTATRTQKCVFAFISGTLLHNVWAYSFYLFGGMLDFSPLMHALVTSPNPFWAIIYYFVALKIFKLSPVRSLNTMYYVYSCWTFHKTISRLISSTILIAEEGARYNFMTDALKQIFAFMLLLAVYYMIKRYLAHNKGRIRFIEPGFFNKKTALLSYFLKTSFIYILMVTMPILIPNQAYAFLLLNIVLALFFALNVYLDLHRYERQVNSNQQVHISALFKGMEEFRGIKHDFYNILHTYSGYLELKQYDRLEAYHNSLVEATTHAGIMVDLGRRMTENPSLVSLLLDKFEYSEKMGLKMMLSFQCDIDDFFIRDLDVTRVVSCLMDNAMEAAVQSADRRIYFSCEAKDKGTKLIIITNSTAKPVDIDRIQIYGMTTKDGHSGIGLHTVRSTLDKYANCSFRMDYFDREVSAYIEFRQA